MARRRTPRRRAAEAEQYQLYTAFLSDPDNTNKKALSPTSINDYAKAVSAGRKLTEAAREAGARLLVIRRPVQETGLELEALFQKLTGGNL